MSEIPGEAIEMATERLIIVFGYAEDHCKALAEEAILAAEQAWPHDPPKRDVRSTIADSTQVAYQPSGYHRFGFGPATVKA